MHTRTSVIALASAAILAACSSKDTGGNNRDTMLGQSGLPGAQGVTKALRAADSVKAKQAQADTITP